MVEQERARSGSEEEAVSSLADQPSYTCSVYSIKVLTLKIEWAVPETSKWLGKGTS
jgi:hypothetical protein